MDAAILNRPSRFDRRYYFDLPGAAERHGYVGIWFKDLPAELRLSAGTIAGLVEQTEGLSFAYLKELFLSSMMQWMANAGVKSMDEIILFQAVQLREQAIPKTGAPVEI